MNREPFGDDEWYHCYTRGVEKRKTFVTEADYRRFLQLLYLCNSDKTIHRSNFLKAENSEIFSVERGNQLVHIGSYCLMQNHFHLMLRQNSKNGISTFMQKLGTAYTMYFNIKNARTGNLFVKPFRSKQISDDLYLKRLLSYIHLNPIELCEPKWKSGIITSNKNAHEFLMHFSYSSLTDYYVNTIRPEKSILSESAMDLLKDELPSLEDLIQDSKEYYTEVFEGLKF